MGVGFRVQMQDGVCVIGFAAVATKNGPNGYDHFQGEQLTEHALTTTITTRHGLSRLILIDNPMQELVPEFP